MKIKFISKKQREQLKQIKQKTINFQQAKRLQQFSSKKQGHQQQHKKQVSNKIQQQMFNVKQNRIQQQKDVNKQSKQNQGRQRSRDLRPFCSRSHQQSLQLNEIKKKYLGLLKHEKTKRNTDHYKNNLLFQWNQEDDTFKTGGYLGQVVGKAQDTYASKRIDHVNQQKTNNWKGKKFQDMTERDWRIFREDNQIFIKGGRVPNPIREWTQMPQLNQILLDNLKKYQYMHPRPIQMQAITIGYDFRDMIAIAPTGEGKTLAYLLPIINFILPLERIIASNSQKGPYAIILSPSRELAQQIQAQLLKISSGLKIQCIRLVGGYQMQLQSISLWKGADIIIGTPGRIKQMVEKRHLSLERLSWVVIDEADKMISQNLAEEVHYIMQNSSSESVLVEKLKRDKVVHMFSATMIPEIQKMIKTFLAPNAAYITIGEPGGGKKQIDQHVQLIDEQYKNQRLGKILSQLPGPIIIFVNERDSCGPLVKRIEQRWRRTAGQYHGGKNQQNREKTITQFRAGKIQILVATDLAGRGLDVKGINAVINYDAPKNISEFIHRAGRTGRAGMKGKCFTLLTSADQSIFYDIRIFLEKNSFKIPENLKDHPAALVKPGSVLSVPRRKQIVYTN